MVTGHVFIAVSLDGYIAREDGDLDWLMKQPTAGEEHGYQAFIETVDGIVMGRGTFEKVLSFGDWPYTQPVIVMSGTLTPADLNTDLQGKVRIMAEPPRDVFRILAGEGWTKAYVDGGRLIRSFLREGLIEDMLLTRIPILLGSGISLFGGLEREIDLEHVNTKVFPSGAVDTTYRVRGRLPGA